jgi:type II restriction enzyme
MIESIRADRAPHLLVLQYTPTWTVRNLLVVPSFFFNETAIRKRAALSPTARRAGWVGCDIALSEIAPQGKLRVVREGEALSVESVREAFRRASALASVPPRSRGWTLDVLRLVQQLPRRDFTIDDAYTFERELQRLYPANRNVRPKIRQQLQVLRDKGFLQFTGRGRYSFLP